MMQTYQSNDASFDRGEIAPELSVMFNCPNENEVKSPPALSKAHSVCVLTVQNSLLRANKIINICKV